MVLGYFKSGRIGKEKARGHDKKEGWEVFSFFRKSADVK